MYNLIPNGNFEAFKIVGEGNITFISSDHIKVEKSSSDSTAQAQFFVKNVTPGTTYRLRLLARKISGRPTVVLSGFDADDNFVVNSGATGDAIVRSVFSEDWELIEVGFCVTEPDINYIRIAFGGLSADDAVGEFKLPHLCITDQIRSQSEYGARIIAVGAVGWSNFQSQFQVWENGVIHNVDELLWDTDDKTLTVTYKVTSVTREGVSPIVLVTPFVRANLGESYYGVSVISQGNHRFIVQFHDSAGAVIDVPNDATHNMYFNFVVMA